MMQLHLALEGLDGGCGLALAWDHREHVRDRAARVGRRHMLVGKAAMDGLDVLEPEQACDFARDHRAGAGDAGADRGRGQYAQAGAALERCRDPAAASTTSQPTKNTARPASPNVITRSRRRAGAGATATGRAARSA